jgi:hypothetical protein
MSILASRATKLAAILAATPYGLARFWHASLGDGNYHGTRPVFDVVSFLAKTVTAQRVFHYVRDS